MNNIETYLKAIILLINEESVNKKISSGSVIKELIDELSDVRKVKTFNDDTEIVDKLKMTLLSIVNDDIKATEDLLVTIEMALISKPSLFKIIDKYSKRKTDNIIFTLKRELNDTLQRIRVKKFLQLSLNKSLPHNADVDLVLANLKDFIDKNKKSSNSTTHASVIDEVDFNDIESVKDAARKAIELVTGSTILKTGWPSINNMTQGGLRRGETVTVAALPHNYKSSFVKSLFLQMCRYNKPEVAEGKKALMLFISLEEEVDNIMYFFYIYLKLNLENHTVRKKERASLKSDDVANYVHSVLEKTGFHVKILRARPDRFSKDVFENIIEGYENKGFEVISATLDYASKMSKKGLDVGGPSGTDLLQLFSILRNITSSKNILLLTPAQLSTTAKALLQNGLEDSEFVKYVGSKNGYYQGTRALDTEIDLELFVHLLKNKGKPARLAVQRGKHRIPTVISEDDKYSELEFLDHINPIPEETLDFKPCKKEDESSSEFDF